MSTRANVVIEYEDLMTGSTVERWLYHHRDGYVQGIGESIVRAVRDCGGFVDSEFQVDLLRARFPEDFEIAVGLEEDIEFLYRISFKDRGVTVVARHGGYAGKDAEQRYRRANDTPDNSVTLFSLVYARNKVVTSRLDIREPESYVRTLVLGAQPGVRAWRGRLRQWWPDFCALRTVWRLKCA